MTQTNTTQKFEEEELLVYANHHIKAYFLDILNGDLSVEEARENLASFRNSAFYTGNDPKYMEIIED